MCVFFPKILSPDFTGIYFLEDDRLKKILELLAEVGSNKFKCKHKELQGLIAIYVHQIVFKTEVAAVKSYLNDERLILLTKGILFFKFTFREK